MAQPTLFTDDSGLTGEFQPGVPDKVTPEDIQPTPEEMSEQVAQIIEAMEYSRHHETGVTMLRMFEICGVRSVTKRVSEARDIYEKKGETIEYRKATDSYFLVPYRVK